MQKPKVIQISESLYGIPELNHSVKLQTKKGRTLLLCSCKNHTKFCLENPWCFHKQLVMEFISRKPILDFLNKLIKDYEAHEGIADKIKTSIVLYDLNKLEKQFDL